MPHGSVYEMFLVNYFFCFFLVTIGEVQVFLTLILCNGTEGEGEDGVFNFFVSLQECNWPWWAGTRLSDVIHGDELK